jgi:tRNA(adenine34) deaminase
VTVDPARTRALMTIALEEARAALAHDDVPVGAVVARRADGEVLARRHNERELAADPTAHAELLALRDAATALGRWRLDDCVLVVTLEPCAMCAGALVNARIGEVVYGAFDLKAGALGSRYHLLADPRLNHECPVTVGVEAEAAAELLRGFFSGRRP